jgi:hypothetical protein
MYYKISLVLVLSFICISCNGIEWKHGFGRIKGSGDIVNREIITTEFNGIFHYGTGTVNIYPDKDYKVTITTYSNMHQIFDIYVENDILQIDYWDNLQKYKPYDITIDIYLPELKTIVSRGPGNIIIDNGNIDNLIIELSDSGNIDAHKYEAENIDVIISGSGTIKIWSTNILNVNMTGPGTIYYKGNPSIQGFNSGGTGRIRQL